MYCLCKDWVKCHFIIIATAKYRRTKITTASTNLCLFMSMRDGVLPPPFCVCELKGEAEFDEVVWVRNDPDHTFLIPSLCDYEMRGGRNRTAFDEERKSY